MKRFQRITANVIFSLNILVIFFLIFRERLDFPSVIQAFGRTHPLLLHLPIGMMVLTLVIVLFRKNFESGMLQTLLVLVLHLTALTAALTALMGVILSAEGGYDPDLLNRHLITGVAVSLLTWAMLLMVVYVPEKKVAFYSMLGVSIVFLMAAGHFGAILTHGENFVLAPLTQDDQQAMVITDSTSFYDAAIQPVFDAKCRSCHNDRKAKGDLIVTSLDKILKGGEDGALWVAGAPEKSLLMKRVLLPEDHDDHMPPSGKPQLGDEEIALLHRWIKSGADVKTAWTKIPPGDSLRVIGDKFIARNKQQPEEKKYLFEFASSETLEALNSPYLTVAQFALDEPALKADFFLSQRYDTKKLDELLKVKEQVVMLNLSNMPLQEEDFNAIRQFTNLEKINLNNTPAPASGIDKLKDLKKLNSISLAGTPLDKSAFEDIANNLQVKEIYTWNTKLTDADRQSLQKQFPSIHWNGGFVPDESEILRLTAPLLVNESTVLDENQGVVLRHNLPGTTIRYTTDGSEPDSVSGTVYEKPFPISGYSIVKAIAVKDHWRASPVLNVSFFRKGLKPADVTFLQLPNKDYQGKGPQTLTDQQKGKADNYRVESFVGYRETSLASLFRFAEAPTLEAITISYARNVGSYLMPPASVEVWGGESPDHMTLLKKVTPLQPSKVDDVRMDAVRVDLPATAYQYYKVIAVPVQKLPTWHSGKGEKGWIFVDEVFFN